MTDIRTGRRDCGLAPTVELPVVLGAGALVRMSLGEVAKRFRAGEPVKLLAIHPRASRRDEVTLAAVTGASIFVTSVHHVLRVALGRPVRCVPRLLPLASSGLLMHEKQGFIANGVAVLASDLCFTDDVYRLMATQDERFYLDAMTVLGVYPYLPANDYDSDDAEAMDATIGLIALECTAGNFAVFVNESDALALVTDAVPSSLSIAYPLLSELIKEAVNV